MNNKYFVYIIRCSGDRLYTGYTTDPVKRFNEHKSGRGGAKFTRGFKPVSFERVWEVSGTKGDAMKIEAFIKSLNRTDKTALIAEPLMLKKMISETLPDIIVNAADIIEFEK